MKRAAKKFPTAPSSMEWNNEENRVYNERQGHGYLKRVARIRGLFSCADLFTVFPALKAHLLRPGRRTTKILEVGAGDGRVIDWLLVHLPVKAKLLAVEYARPRVKALERKYRLRKDVRIIDSSVLDLPRAVKDVDVALWMWSGILELNDDEKREALVCLYAALKRPGLLVVDLPDDKVRHTKRTFVHGHKYWEKDRYGTFRGDLITKAQLKEFATSAGFKLLKTCPYRTDRGVNRASLVFGKALERLAR